VAEPYIALFPDGGATYRLEVYPNLPIFDVGEIDLRFRVRRPQWHVLGEYSSIADQPSFVAARGFGTDMIWRVTDRTEGLRFEFAADTVGGELFSAVTCSPAALGFTDGQFERFRITYDYLDVGPRVRFWTSDDGTAWTLAHTATVSDSAVDFATAGAGALQSGLGSTQNDGIQVGNGLGAAGRMLDGDMAEFEMRDGIAGPVVAALALNTIGVEDFTWPNAAGGTWRRGASTVLSDPVTPALFAIDIAFGHGPFEELTEGDWTDVTEHLDISGSDFFAETITGRAKASSGIEPGSLVFALENPDGRYDPRNTASPHHGDLTLGVPARIRVSDTVIWQGFIDSGWPQQLTARLPVVPLSAHDVVGLIAQADAPESVFDAATRSLSSLTGDVVAPDHWWTPGPDGWVDRITGRHVASTGALQEMDPVVNTDEKAWGQTDADGYAPLGAPLETGPHATVVSVWVRFPRERLISPSTGTPATTWILDATNPARTLSRLFLAVTDTGIDFGATSYTETSPGVGQLGFSWFRTIEDDLNLHDGRPHHILMFVEGGAGGALIIDGRYVLFDLVADATGPGTPDDIAFDLRIGAALSTTPYQGVIDHVMIWANVTHVNIDTWAQQLVAAGRDAWAGQRLDERFASVVDSIAPAYRGAAHSSGVVTRHSYRRADPVELLQKLEDTEQGRIWVDHRAGGKLRFYSRSWAWSVPEATTVQVTFSDDPDLQDSGDAIAFLDEGTVIVDDPFSATNVAQVTSEFGRQQTATDPASIARIGRRNPVQLSGLLHGSDAESLSIAEWIIASQSEARPKVESLAFDVWTDPENLLPIATSIEEGWLVRVRKHPPLDPSGDPIGDEIDLYGHVVGIRHRFGFHSWIVELTLDATRAGWSWFTWDESEWDNDDDRGWSF
jgi:hypothetical protein